MFALAALDFFGVFSAYTEDVMYDEDAYSSYCRRARPYPPYSKNSKDHSDAHVYLYILRLEDNCWYVGTTNNPSSRLQQHHEQSASSWTSLHKVIGEISTLKDFGYSETEAKLQEDVEVKRLMKQYGIDHVRGGS